MKNIDWLLRRLTQALDGTGAALEFPGSGMHELPEGTAPKGTAVVVGTSGSTGKPKRVVLSASALIASAQASAQAIGTEGQWLLAVPLSYVAGVQVLIRSVLSGNTPAVVSGKFSSNTFLSAAQQLSADVRLVSLVPTQLHRLLADPRCQEVLQRFDAVLLGGAATNPQLLETAHSLGIRLVRSYGSAETCGGCVYDGVALNGVQIRFEPGPAGDRIWLGGATVASGYLDDPERSAQSFRLHNGVRWYRSSDLGMFDEAGQLRVLGRADDVIVTGGLKASAETIAKALLALPGVREAFVTGVDDADWGQRVVAAVVLADGPPPDPARKVRWLREEASRSLSAHEIPKEIRFVSELPLLNNGKIDRQRLRGVLTSFHDNA